MIQKLLMRLISISLGLFSLCFVVPSLQKGGGGWEVVVFTLLLIAAGTVWICSDPKTYNAIIDTVKLAPNPHGLGMDDIFNVFKDLGTPLGKPWMGKVRFIMGQSMIFGPDIDGEYIYVYNKGLFFRGCVKITQNMLPGGITAPEGEEWRLDPKQRAKRENTGDTAIHYQFAHIGLMDELTDRMTRFLDDPDLGIDPVDTAEDSKKYMFNEEFRWTGQDFYLSDTKGNKKLKVSAPLPCKTFCISQMADGAEIFKLTKRIFHILPHYDLYENGVKIGRMRKRFVLHHDIFVAKTPYGKLELRSIAGTISANYKVSIDKTVIGTIARNLKPTIKNVVFENFVLVVKNSKYLGLMTAMGVMAARELRRDQWAAKEALNDEA